MKKKITIIVLSILLITMCTVATYAYFSASINGNSNNKNIKVDMSKMKLEFSDKTGKVVADNINPGWTYQKKVSVTNTGNVLVKYDLVWLNLQNEIEKDEMVYSITCNNCNGIDESPVPTFGGENLKIVTNTIEATQTQEYTINFKFKELNDPQNYNQNKVFTGNIGIKENNTYDEKLVGMLSNTGWGYTLDEENSKVVLNGYKTSSYGSNGYKEYDKNVKIYSEYIINNKKYKTVIKEIVMNHAGPGSLFSGDVTSVKFLGNVEFENNSMKWLFNGCKNLTDIDISFLDTSNITDMSGLFYNCNSINSIDLSNFDTSNVTLMDSMFSYCNSLTSLDLSNFDFSNVKVTTWTFKYIPSNTRIITNQKAKQWINDNFPELNNVVIKEV